MNPQMVLIPILLPIACGLLLYSQHEMEERTRRIFLLASACVTSIYVWVILLHGPTGVYTLYRFVQGFSIDFCVDVPAMIFAGMVSVMWPFLLLYGYAYMEHEHHKNSFFSFYLMTYGITLGLAFSASIVTMFVFYEMLTLVTLPLVIHYRDRDSIYAAQKYAAYLLVGAALAFVAVILVTLNGNEGVFILGGSLAGNYDKDLLRLAFLCGFFGFGTKAAVFPLYDWLPTASIAPTPVTSLLHAVAVVNSGAFAVMRLIYYSCGTELLAGTWEQNIALLFSAFTIAFSALQALRERHFKRRLAFSTSSNLSYMLFGFSCMTAQGFIGGLSHLLFHGMIKMVLFMCAGAFMTQTGKAYIYEVNGAGRKMPWVFGLFTLSAIGLIGFPMTSGFVSKYHLVMAGLEQGTGFGVVGVVCLIISAVLCSIYTLTISVRAFFPPKGQDRFAHGERISEPGLLMLVPMGLFVFFTYAFGMWPGGVLRLIGSVVGVVNP